MQKRVSAVILCGLALLPSALAKDKKQALFPAYILRARTVAVLVDASAGVEIQDPQANRMAQKDVEAALLKWGRYDVVIDSATADLLIVVRRGNSRVVNETIPDPEKNRRPGSITTTESSIQIAGQRGRQPNAQGQVDSPEAGAPRPRVEGGRAEDAFAVYQGQPNVQPQDSLEAAPGWRYIARDALRSHSVPAVDVFRKALAEAEKAVNKP